MEARTHKRNDWRKTVTLPKNLQEKRDAMCEAYKQECLDNWHSPGLYLKPDFKKGFEEACKLLLPEIEKLENTIDHATKYLESCGYNDVDLSEPEFQMLQSFYQALQSLREFMGSEGDKR